MGSAINKKAQAAAQRIRDQAVAEGREGAIQVAVCHRGRLVVDVWAAPSGRPVDGLSLFPVYSTGKGIAATAIHRLVERGILSWEEPLARRWPEFAAHGKAGITLRQVLDHTSGMAMLPADGRMEELTD